jgi:hypothetical protein
VADLCPVVIFIKQFKTKNKNNMDENNQLIHLDFNPILKGLLINYITFQYEGDAKIDDWHVWQEYVYLRDNNLLNDLFIQEYLDNPDSY